MHSNLPLTMATYIKSCHLSRSVIVLAFILYLSLFSCILCVASVNVGKRGGFVQIKGPNFVINGSPFLFNGFNAYWMMNVATDPSERYKVSQVLQDSTNAGLSVCRTWAFADGVDDKALQISPGVYDERVFQGLDFVVAEARKYGLRLILSFVNNYKDFGGRPQYVEWARSSGVQLKSDDDFYTNPVVKGYYKNHVERVITRVNTVTKISYSDDTTIMAWELINEPRCQLDYSGRMVNGWVQEMALFVKSLDRHHLLEIGMEGFYGDTMPERKQINPGYQVGTDFISSNRVKEIDFATIHAYPDQWLSGQNDDSQMAFMQRWMSSHYEDSRTILKKPLVIAEFGKSSKDPDYNINKRNSYMNAVYRNIYMEAKSGGTVGGGLVWQLMADGMGSYGDGYEIILSENPSTDSIISQQSHAMGTLAHMLRSGPENVAVNQASEVEFGQVRGPSYVVNHRKGMRKAGP
ncbi:putative mannan endo-1,4-beta-mannosidase [Helianthus annuus]|uniref:mannan endo-1,4-beta-mannosidase n=2 Tax=Helianthus annuus TaxID=4232 RepID=A0A251U184_HELAN|nr:putative mannan endo-1,4-beta-mannosidase [Helianthus annuus]KAJ0527184.1 putative mannan endo-1,4-beta-mannosidase [Helianthus annuus]KAJ0543586.1 putative mannan endo-1,4-beta-mannosidase [Helianthus annuus]KAJ0708640.1 putative mannan endo-1,4-beta-mannosidase [Helianthus annuus]KAJ0889673.1 putative mannan endo-1,4-beta-mannosidase [Helianthus annuus]